MAVSKPEVVTFEARQQLQEKLNKDLEALGLALSSGINAEVIPHQPTLIKHI